MTTSADPEVLYHYATGEGILGVCTSASFRASRIEVLNDGKELRYAFELALPELALLDVAGLPHDALRGAREVCERDYHGPSVYVAAFSAARDSLSQWRAYGRHGDCYAIGFERQQLAQTVARSSCTLVRCEYRREVQLQLIRERLRWAAEAWRRGDFSDRDEYERGFALTYSYLLEIAPRIKHPAFVDEQEWRIVTNPGPMLNIGYRVGRQSLIPYAQVPVDGADGRLVLADVLVGPRAHQQLALYAASDFILRTGASVAPYGIGGAGAPYRDW